MLNLTKHKQAEAIKIPGSHKLLRGLWHEEVEQLKSMNSEFEACNQPRISRIVAISRTMRNAV